MAFPPAAVESATTTQVPFLTGAYAAYNTISLLLPCAKTANPEISHTAQALLRQAKIKFGFLKAATCMFPSPDAVSGEGNIHVAAFKKPNLIFACLSRACAVWLISGFAVFAHGSSSDIVLYAA